MYNGIPYSMSSKTRYGFWIDNDLLVGLRTLKERDGILESEQIRRAIRAWLAKKDVKVTTPRPRGRAPRKRG
jgi:hypothetical protein